MSILTCAYCGHQEDSKTYDGVVLFIKEKGTQKKLDVKVCCKGECLKSLEDEAHKSGYTTGFFELLTDLKSSLYFPQDFTDKALDKYKKILSKYE